LANDPHSIKHSRPAFFDSFNLNSSAIDRHGSTSGNLGRGGLSVVAATATGLTFTLPSVEAGVPKQVAVSYLGATGSLTIRTNTTAQLFGGSTLNVVSVASGEPLAMLTLVGTTASRWAVQWSASPTTGVAPISFSAAT